MSCLNALFRYAVCTKLSQLPSVRFVGQPTQTNDQNSSSVAVDGNGRFVVEFRVYMTETQRYSILITDDDRGVREALAEIVENKGFRPVLASDGEEAITIVQAQPIHLAVFDLNMPKMTGLEAMEVVRQIAPILPAILMTADATLDVMRRAFAAHFFSVVPKPLNANMVVQTVVRALVRVYGPEVELPQQPTTQPPTGATQP